MVPASAPPVPAVPARAAPGRRRLLAVLTALTVAVSRSLPPRSRSRRRRSSRRSPPRRRRPGSRPPACGR